jgi:3-oxoacyl-[acyl-carrier protein] reductase
MSAPLEGKVAIVTGSSRGIGAAIVQQLASAGASVVINYLTNAHAAHEVATTINSTRAGTAIAVQADASTIAGGEKLLDECIRAFGRIDILVLNAGLATECTLAQAEESLFDSTFDIHVKGPLFLSRAVAGHLPPGTSIYPSTNSPFAALTRS